MPPMPAGSVARLNLNYPGEATIRLRRAGRDPRRKSPRDKRRALRESDRERPDTLPRFFASAPETFGGSISIPGARAGGESVDALPGKLGKPPVHKSHRQTDYIGIRPVDA